MPSDDNPFVWFKNHVDSVFRGIVSVPSSHNQTKDDARHNHDRLDEVALEHIRRSRERRAGSTLPSPDPGSPRAAFNEIMAQGIRQRAIQSWVSFSAYSPQNLYYLPQPIPNDKPSHSTERFTFADAFEDLLAINSGQPMAVVDSNRDSLRAMRRMSRNTLFGVFSSFQWSRDLEHRQLWGAYFPEYSHLAQRIQSMPHFDLSRDLDTIAMCKEEKKLQELLPSHDWLDNVKYNGNGEYEFHALLQELFKLYNPWMEKIRHVENAEEYPSPPPQEAHTEEDTYLSVKSDFTTRGGFSFTSSRPGFDHATESERTIVTKSRDSETTETVSVSPDGLKVVKTVERGTTLGMNRLKTTTVTYDAEGNVVQRMVSYQMSTGGTSDTGSDSAYTSGEDEDETKQQDKRNNTGWFWTR